MKFSVALIAKDEANTLPRLLDSLKDFTAQGGEVVVLDTGSTDGTPELARSLGCRVTEAGDRFTRVITKKQAKAINEPLERNGEGPGVSEGDRCFDFASARNEAAELCSNDWVITPDCDELVTMDIAALEKMMTEDSSLIWCKIKAGTIEWSTTRCYNKKFLVWDGITHEFLKGKDEVHRPPKFADLKQLSLNHFQEPKEERPKRINGLALEAHLKDSPRSLFYYGRDLLWRGKNKTAIEVFQKQLKMASWTQEKAEALAFVGDAYAALKEEDNAYQAWFMAWHTDPQRRVGLMRAAKYAYGKADWPRVVVYASAALQIPFASSYIEDMAIYGHLPHEYLYPALWQLGRKEESKDAFNEARKLNPSNPKTRADARWYDGDPMVSVVIPHLPTPRREERLAKCLKAIKDNADYTNYEIIVENDSWTDNQGACKTLAKGVNRSKGELVLFMGNDTVANPGFMRKAVESMRVHFPDMDGLIGINDSFRTDDMATCWLGSKKLLPHIGGDFFYTGYYHCFGDGELIERCKILGKYYFDKNVTVVHEWLAQTESDPVYQLAYKQERWDHDKALFIERSKTFAATTPLFPMPTSTCWTL